MIRRGLVCVALLVFCCSAVSLFAQGAVSEVSGSAADQSGGVLPGVTVTLTEETTGIVRTGVTNETGRFVIAAVQPGRYTIKAELAGFQTQTRTGVPINVGQVITLNLTLPVGTLQDQVTVTGEAPLIELTQSTVGTNITADNIDELPTQGRTQYALLQLVPGLTPTLAANAFEGAQYSAAGRGTASNVFMVDGAYNNDDRTQSGPGAQTRMTIDTTAEYQVLVHEFGAEYGGAAGVIINAVTKGGTNELHGRTAYYLQDQSWNATNYFLKQAGIKPVDSGIRTFVGNIGGPIVRDKAFFFFNFERLRVQDAGNLVFPAEAAPLAVSYSTLLPVSSENYFARVDYQVSASNSLSMRAIFDPNRVTGQSHVANRRTLEALNWERVPSPGETFFNGQWVSVMGTRMVNEFRLSRVDENLQSAGVRLFEEKGDFNVFTWADGGRFAALGDRDPLDFLSPQQTHPDYITGPSSAAAGNKVTTTQFSDLLTFTPASHTLKFGGGASKNGGNRGLAGNSFGTYSFAGNLPFNPANPFSYPNRFTIQQGEIFFRMDDWRANVFVSDKWQATSKLTLNLGVRYDYQDLVSDTKNAFAPRLGMAYALNDATVIRAGGGKFYQFQSTAVSSNLKQGLVTSTVNMFDTGQDNNPVSGLLPTRHPCLLPVTVAGSPGQAGMSAACKAALRTLRSALEAGGFSNPEPVLDGDRRLAYIYSWNLGVQRELFPGTALSADYVGNIGRQQGGRIDVNEPRRLANGTIGRPGPSVFDPNSELIQGAARLAAFDRVLVYDTDPAFNSDYQALELSLVRRQANRWSGRLSYTLSRARDAGQGIETRVVDDLNPKSDYSLSSNHNRHSFAAGGNWDPWRGLGVGLTFRYYSGSPVNETVGLDVNGDRDNTDRPVRGVDDRTLPIASALNANGIAVRNGIPGEKKLLADLRFQYMVNLGQQQHTAGFYWEIYNITDRVNFGNVEGNRRSANFLQSTVADAARSMQIGFRYTF